MTTAILAGSMALPKGRIDVARIKASMTHAYCPMGADEPLEVEAFREDAQYLYVPRQWGLTYCRRNGIEFEDATSQGVEINFKKVPDPRGYQIPVLDEIELTLQDYYDFIFRARTGFGKTISTLIIAARLGRSTIVLVDQENLLDQWVETLTKLFGCAISDVGIVQGNKCIYKGKPVTIAMVQTLRSRRYPKEFYDYFGFMIVDEVHTIGAPTYGDCLLDFSAAYRIGVSATPKRRDGLQKVLDDNLGKVRVYVADAHEKSTVLLAEHPTVYSWYANSSPKAGRYITEISEDGSRNLLCAELAVMFLESGRDTLVLSDRIEQLTHITNLCYYLGVPEGDAGVYAGDTHRYAYVKQAKPKRRPFDLVKHEGGDGIEPGYYYTPVHLQLVAKKTPKKVLQQIKESARLIAATYGKFQKGVDVPRLASGVDATPRSTAEQMHGRILRIEEGKKMPMWATIVDTSSYRAINQLLGRIPDYETNNAQFLHLNEDGTTEPCHETLKQNLRARFNKLKAQKIETDKDGLNTIRLLKSPMMPALRAGNGTARSTHRRLPPERSSPEGSSARSRTTTTSRLNRSPSRVSPSPSLRRR